MTREGNRDIRRRCGCGRRDRCRGGRGFGAEARGG